ncbi:MAG: ADP-ribosylglycohydrolase family protein [Chloroflexi bacterium]|nr:ADP-ribosylglycohydrolase family protein [Chloroflexota bacterium]
MSQFKQNYLYVNNDDLLIERQQFLDEGRDLAEVAEEFAALARTDLETDAQGQTRANALLDRTIELPMRDDYGFAEPSDLDGIRRARPHNRWRAPRPLDDDVLFDKVVGAWLGRCAGCLLGKPVEGWHSAKIWGYLQATGRFPLADYIRSDAPDEIIAKYQIPRERAYIDRVSHMVEDDDLNYTVIGFAIMKQHGVTFTPLDVATFWMQNLPLLRTFTAERVAYRNFCRLISPPESASFRNPYREWIGAQIRADFWGYAALGNPELAAEFAWRDASVSHVKNGIYGEMWVAAMLAAAPFIENPRKVIEIGLGEIPTSSRLASDIRQVIAWHAAGVSYDQAVERIHARWDETNTHHWCHTNSNAQIVAVGLLWGDRDYEKSICRAVQACFDTDCNGATVGSIVGMMHGAHALPAKWIRPLNDTLETGVRGYGRRHISDLAREGFQLVQALKEPRA